MQKYYKAVRPDGTDFYSGTVQWAPPKGYEGEWIVKHPTNDDIHKIKFPSYSYESASDYLSVATVSTDCTGMRWPCRLFVVEPVEGFHVITPDADDLPNKRAACAWRVVEEIDSTQTLGENGKHVIELLEFALNPDNSDKLFEAYNNWCDIEGKDLWTAQDNMMQVSNESGSNAAVMAIADHALEMMTDATANPIDDAISALIMRGIISQKDYDILTGPVRKAGITVHPDDKELNQ